MKTQTTRLSKTTVPSNSFSGIIAKHKTLEVFAISGGKTIKITPENEKKFGIILGKK